VRTMLTSLTAAVAFAGALGTANAQPAVSANVPFPFIVHGAQFPAGRYDIDVDGSVLPVRSRDGRSAALALGVPAGGTDLAGDSPVLVFTRYEDTYRLAQVWVDDTMAYDLLPRHGTVPPRAAGVVAADPATLVAASRPAPRQGGDQSFSAIPKRSAIR